ncbi:MAG: hypothetical protein ACYS0E_14350, partial [Planctomycetota bacterium]
AIMTEAARHAVRLSGTEFVLFHKEFHEQPDTVWTLDEIHDGAARMTAEIPGTRIKKQVFPISFRDSEDLMRRIAGIAQSQLHRIRYVWPYSIDQPVVIRDTTLPMPHGGKVPVRRIKWTNPEKNGFVGGPVFNVTVQTSSLYVHKLSVQDFRLSEGTATDFDPMSNVSYRVYQLRVVPENVWFRIATGALVGLLVAAAVAAVFALRRQQRERVAARETAED